MVTNEAVTKYNTIVCKKADGTEVGHGTIIHMKFYLALPVACQSHVIRECNNVRRGTPICICMISIQGMATIKLLCKRQ